MPGYLTNRYISFSPSRDLASAQSSLNTSISATNSNVSDLTNRVSETEGNIEDLQLNIGV